MSRKAGTADVLSAAAFICALAGSPGAAQVPVAVPRLAPGSPAEDYARASLDAPYRLIATLDQRGMVTTRSITASRLTVIARIDSVLQKPRSVRLARGGQFTLILADSNDAVPGGQYVVLAHAIVLGTSPVLRETGHVRITSAQAADSVVRRVAEGDSINLRSAILGRGRHALVVDATVDSVTPVPRSSRSRRTEHQPDWQRAHLRINEWISPRGAGSDVMSVWFPRSRSAMFAGAPSLSMGERSILLLQPGDSLPGSLKSGYDYEPGQRYLLRSIDKLSPAQLALVRDLYR